MTEQNALSLSDQAAKTGVQVKVDINADAIVTVAVSKAEKAMNATIAEKAKEIKAAELAKKTAEKNLADALEAHGKDLLGAAETAFKDAAKLAGGSIKTELTVAVAATVKEVEATLRVHASSGYGGYTQFQKTCEPSEAVVTSVAEAKRLEEALVALRAEVVAVRRRLTNLPSLERSFKARIIEGQLGKTDAGRELLDQLGLDTIEAEVLRLPSL